MFSGCFLKVKKKTKNVSVMMYFIVNNYIFVYKIKFIYN